MMVNGDGERIYEHGSGGEIMMVTMGLFIGPHLSETRCM